MLIKTIRWHNDRVELIDQRVLPGKTRYITCRTARDMFLAIRKMKVRGAPAIGIAGAYGVYLGVRKSRAKEFDSFEKDVHRTVAYLADSRPTARNLFWALERMGKTVRDNSALPIKKIKKKILDEARKIHAEDIEICKRIGENGRKLIPAGANVLTHCNAGGLATGGFGTALGVIIASQKKIKHVFIDETRPVLQGARLTAWELLKAGIPSTLICDNMSGSLMAEGEIDAVIVGADRIAANGDTANKIGTYNLAVLADFHRVPFYVAAPFSTFDLSIPNGRHIPIEMRSPREVKELGGRTIAPKNVKAYNPAFDVTPRTLITAIITEGGVIREPDRAKIKKMVGRG